MGSKSDIQFSVLVDDNNVGRQTLGKRQRLTISLVLIIFFVVVISIVAYYESKPSHMSDELSVKLSRLRATGANQSDHNDKEVPKSSVTIKNPTRIGSDQARQNSSTPEFMITTPPLPPDSDRASSPTNDSNPRTQISSADGASPISETNKDTTTLEPRTKTRNKPQFSKLQLTNFSLESGKSYNIFSEQAGKVVEKIKVYRHFIAYKVYDRSRLQRFVLTKVNGSLNHYAIISYDNYYLTYQDNDEYKMAVFQQATDINSRWIVERDQASKGFVIKSAAVPNLCLVDSISAKHNHVLNDVAPCVSYSAEKRWFFVRVC